MEPARICDWLEPTLDPREAHQGPLDIARRNFEEEGDRDGGQGVDYIVGASERDLVCDLADAEAHTARDRRDILGL